MRQIWNIYSSDLLTTKWRSIMENSFDPQTSLWSLTPVLPPTPPSSRSSSACELIKIPLKYHNVHRWVKFHLQVVGFCKFRLKWWFKHVLEEHKIKECDTSKCLKSSPKKCKFFFLRSFSKSKIKWMRI